MLFEWLSPLLAWLGIGFIPFLLLVIIIVLIVRG